MVNMDYKQLLLSAGLPCVDAYKDDETNQIVASFARELTQQEWQIYLKVINPPTWNDIRAERDKRLAACDWTQMLDAVLTFDERSTWQSYRQSLRDIPQLYPSPELVVWPEKP
jgi:hypothetical protein